MLLLSDVPKSLHKNFMADMENAIGQHDSSLSYFAVFHAFEFLFRWKKNLGKRKLDSVSPKSIRSPGCRDRPADSRCCSAGRATPCAPWPDA